MHIYFSAIFPAVGIDRAAQFPARVCHGPIRSTRRGVSASVLVDCCISFCAVSVTVLTAFIARFTKRRKSLVSFGLTQLLRLSRDGVHRSSLSIRRDSILLVIVVSLPPASRSCYRRHQIVLASIARETACFARLSRRRRRMAVLASITREAA